MRTHSDGTGTYTVTSVTGVANPSNDADQTSRWMEQLMPSIRLEVGEYECLLNGDIWHSNAITWLHERGRFVVYDVHPMALFHWPAVHRGHVLCRINHLSIAPMSSVQELEEYIHKQLDLHKRVQLVLCDTKRQNVEMQLLKDDPHALVRRQHHYDHQPLEPQLQQAFNCIWSHALDLAFQGLLSFRSPCADPRILLYHLDIDVIRVLISHDALYIQQAKATAVRVVASLQTLSTLSSLSQITKWRFQVALAEALLHQAGLECIHKSRVAAMASFRAAAKRLIALESEMVATSFDHPLFHSLLVRVRSGLGIFRLLPCLVSVELQWLTSFFIGNGIAPDLDRGLADLLACASSTVEDRASIWAMLLLVHCITGICQVLRRSKQIERAQQLRETVYHDLGPRLLTRHPNAVLFLWTMGNCQLEPAPAPEPAGEDPIVHALQFATQKDRSHLIAYDVGMKLGIQQWKWTEAEPLWRSIAQTTSAPIRLRAMSSLFLAMDRLVSYKEVSPNSLHSVRLLLRAALRFLNRMMQANEKEEWEDLQCLSKRVQWYVNASDQELWLLPCEILYVFYHSDKPSTHSNDHHHHDAMLHYLDMHCPSHHDDQVLLTWQLLRAIMESLIKREPHLQIESFAAILTQCAPVDRSFVAPVACFHYLKHRFQAQASEDVMQDDVIATIVASSVDCDYASQYAGKLAALWRLWTKKSPIERSLI